tara:strand:+ start:496 stop:1656 length:1161 start_codon:yes stop_codon:yes gene_type:complete
MKYYPQVLMLLGSGELGKEIVIAAKRIGCRVIACDRYENAPAMQISDECEIFNMNDPKQLKKIIEKHNPDYVIPEIEALAVDILKELETKGIKIIPNANATEITMNRDKIRNLASDVLKLKTANFHYASNINELKNLCNKIKWPVIVKPVMSSSGKGQSVVKKEEELEKAWITAVEGARGKTKKVIVEEFIKFNSEITLLTIRQRNGKTLFCDPIGHEQSNGDYQCSWQPACISKKQLEEAQSMAKRVTEALGGYGLFGVEFFICEDEVVFSELSPRPHDTGLVTLISQNLNEFELHIRAILGLPIPEIKRTSNAASRVILSKKDSNKVRYQGLEKALEEKDTSIFLFGKPTSREGRRMGVALALGETIEQAQHKADKSANYIKVI